MLNVLLSLRNPSPEGIRLCMYYGVCAALIVVGLIVIAARKRKQKKQLRAETVKKYCLKAKAHAEKSLALQEHKNIQAMFGSTKLLALSNHVAEAAWYAFQIAETKGEIVFSGIANELDSLASSLAKESEMGYIPAAEFEKQTRKAIDGLNATLEKLNALITEKTKTK